MIFDLQKKIRELQGELDQLKSIRVVQVQFLSRHESDVMKSARDELATTLTQRINDFELEIVKCMKATEIQPDKPLILLCIGTHAVAQDIRNTVKGIEVSKKSAVVVVHLKAEHALPVHPRDRILTKNSNCLAESSTLDLCKIKDYTNATQMIPTSRAL